MNVQPDDRCPACEARLESDPSLQDGDSFRCDACACVIDLAPAPVAELAALLAA